MPKIPGRLITYCSNIHPGESWQETFDALRRHVPAVKRGVAPGRPFPIGLRLSDRASRELTPLENRRFREWLDAEGCFVPTLNGFPFGSFHGTRVKEAVYFPDWRTEARAEYTLRLARLLAGWLPEGGTGSISSVPLGFRPLCPPEELPAIRRNLAAALAGLARLYQETGRTVVLALEPEPGCLLETTEEVCRFFSSLELPDGLARHLGLCYDCCHQAVQFEDPARSLERLAAAGVPIAKVQVSSALDAEGPRALELLSLEDSCYLHQVVVRRPEGELLSYADLPEARTRHRGRAGDRVRCHFHVPVFLARTTGCGTTRGFLREFLPRLPQDILLEVETYTWEVLPPELRLGSLTDSVIREIRWTEECLHA